MSGGECLPPRPRTCICTDCGIATEPPSSSDWWGKLVASVRWEAEAESRIMTLDLIGLSKEVGEAHASQLE